MVQASSPTGGQALLAGEYVDPRDLGVRSGLRDFARAYLQDQEDRGRSPRTVAKYASYLAEFVSFVERATGKPRVSDIDIRTLRAFSSHLTRRSVQTGRERGRRSIAAASKNLRLIALRGLLKFGVLLDVPVPGPEKVELTKAADPSPDARHLAAERLVRLLESFDAQTADGVRGRALLELMVATGARVSEVMGLDRRQLELDRRAPTPADGVRIADEVTVLGKGNRHRRVYLTKNARKWLQLHLRLRKDNDAALFVTRKRSTNGERRMSVWTAERIVADAAKRAGLQEHVSPHWMRHAAVTKWATEIGVPAAQRLAGHKSVATTSRYLGGSDAELKALYKAKIDR